jgi:hypothetical protein
MALNFPVFRIAASDLNEYEAARLIQELQSTYQGKKTKLCFHYLINIVPGKGSFTKEVFLEELTKLGFTDQGVELYGARSGRFSYQIIGKESILTIDEFWKDYQLLTEVCEVSRGYYVAYIEPDWPG